MSANLPAEPNPDLTDEHRRFLNSYYRHVRHVYDLTRRFFLFGRDQTLKGLLREPWSSLVEVGPGTGRNLRVLHRARPEARYGGLEASDEMLAHCRKMCPWANLAQGFAEMTPLEPVLGMKPERILFSYCLSMVQEPERAITNARRALAPDGELVVVDFSDLSSLWQPVRGGLQAFLRAFRVSPLSDALLSSHGARLEWGPGRYYVVARFSPLS